MKPCTYCGQRPGSEAPCAVCRSPEPPKPVRPVHVITYSTAAGWECAACRRVITGQEVYARKKPNEEPTQAAGRLFVEMHGEACEGAEATQDVSILSPSEFCQPPRGPNGEAVVRCKCGKLRAAGSDCGAKPAQTFDDLAKQVSSAVGDTASLYEQWAGLLGLSRQAPGGKE